MDQNSDQVSRSDMYSLSGMRKLQQEITFEKQRETGIDVGEQMRLANARIVLLEREFLRQKQVAAKCEAAAHKRGLRFRNVPVDWEQRKQTKSDMKEQIVQFKSRKREIEGLKQKNLDWKRPAKGEQSKHSLSLPLVGVEKKQESKEDINLLKSGREKQGQNPGFPQLRLWGVNHLALHQIMLDKLSARVDSLKKN